MYVLTASGPSMSVSVSVSVLITFPAPEGGVTSLKARKTLPLSHSTVCLDYSGCVAMCRQGKLSESV